MEYRLISLPPFKAACSGVDTSFDFSPEGKLGRFDKWFSAIKPAPRDSFMPRDFLYFDGAAQGLVWMWAMTDEDDGGFETIDFPGGLYLTYAYRDGDDAEGARLRGCVSEFLKNSTALEIDESRAEMGHIITPAELTAVQGWSQMETFVPVKPIAR